MKKLNILGYGAMLALSMTAASCGEEYLTVQPASRISLSEYYSTEQQVGEAVTAAYDPMHWYDYFNGWSPLNMLADCQGDDMFVGGGSTSDQGDLHLISQYRATATSTQSGQKGAWVASYSGINRANLVIEHIDQSPLSEEQKDRIIDEMVTTRAFYYLILWKFWGNIPYYEKNLTADVQYIAPQLTEEEVYENIVRQLEQVIANGKLPMKETDARAGHATKALAEMLYADFVMYQKDEGRYAQALRYMEEIIASGKYKLMDDFEAIFKAEGEWCDESIFEINYFAKGSTRGWGSANAPGGTVFPSMIGIDGMSGSAEFNGGWGFCDISKEVYDKYEEGDIRRDAGILNMEYYAAERAKLGENVKYNGRYQNTGCFLKKYLPRAGYNKDALGDADLAWDNNLRFYRYAETLLNAAELAFRTGDAAKAQGYLDQVRLRAGVPAVTVSLESLLNERRLEFVGEGKRYYDLVRFGKAKEVLKAKGYKVLNADKTQYSVDGIPERPNWEEKYKYLPIPQDEVDAALGSITQNPYND